MPYLKSDAPPGTPDERTVESLMGMRNPQNKRTMAIKCFHELSEQEKANVGLLKLGKRCAKIPGDPFGVLSSWAGNVSHFQDVRMASNMFPAKQVGVFVKLTGVLCNQFDIMSPMFQRLGELPRQNDTLLESIQTMLAKVPDTDAFELVRAVGDHGSIEISRENDEVVVVDFQPQSRTVRLMQCLDIDLDKKAPLDKTNRHFDAVRRAKAAFDEPQMPTLLQQAFMTTKFLESKNNNTTGDSQQQRSTDEYGEELSNVVMLEDLRSEAQERFWLHLSRDERDRIRRNAASSQDDKAYVQVLSLIRSNWPARWNNGAFDVDYFYHYLKDKAAAESVWELVEADIIIITDRKRRVVFASVERAAQLLFGPAVLKEINDCIDLFSFFTPLPRPETKRHRGPLLPAHPPGAAPFQGHRGGAASGQDGCGPLRLLVGQGRPARPPRLPHDRHPLRSDH
ncbi:hypothetical protein PG994_005349 [Apiospora phragmitis]|uniref:Uncharacterized protein n=1 Tax=Apiospora phragmitis TaxID=2905665 RepID=A0ABR1VFR4_9PEZI